MKKARKGVNALPGFFPRYGLLFQSGDTEAFGSPGFSLQGFSLDQVNEAAQALRTFQRRGLLFEFEFVVAIQTAKFRHADPPPSPRKFSHKAQIL